MRNNASRAMFKPLLYRSCTVLCRSCTVSYPRHEGFRTVLETTTRSWNKPPNQIQENKLGVTLLYPGFLRSITPSLTRGCSSSCKALLAEYRRSIRGFFVCDPQHRGRCDTRELPYRQHAHPSPPPPLRVTHVPAEDSNPTCCVRGSWDPSVREGSHGFGRSASDALLPLPALNRCALLFLLPLWRHRGA